jgi:hypothetical protein
MIKAGSSLEKRLIRLFYEKDFLKKEGKYQLVSKYKKGACLDSKL